ncbi:MAG TPA: YqgE/AlgH family protein [Xanthobacteraceae bacterium]|nr:YqgE/AlgH family protein [Xanthobacteraceae bacterium]
MRAFADRRGRWLAWIFAAAAVALPAAVPHAALSPEEPDVGGPTSLAGQLLIATPDMGAPFDHAVILVAQHNRDGALGIIINHPLATRPIARILQALGGDAHDVSGSLPIYFGGPVSPAAAFILHSADFRADRSLDIDGRVALSDDLAVLRDIGLGKGPAKRLLALGYAGWGPRQLDDEIARGAWVSVPETPQLVFDDDRAKLWTDAMALHKTER